MTGIAPMTHVWRWKNICLSVLGNHAGCGVGQIHPGHNGRWRANEYPWVDAHMKQHDQMLVALKSKTSQLLGSKIGVFCLSDLESIMLEHIDGSDLQYDPFCKKS